MHAPYTHSQYIHYLEHHANATGSGTDLEHVQCDDLQSLGVISHTLQVGVGGEHYLKYVQEELQRVLLEEVDLQGVGQGVWLNETTE